MATFLKEKDYISALNVRQPVNESGLFHTTFLRFDFTCRLFPLLLLLTFLLLVQTGDFYS